MYALEYFAMEFDDGVVQYFYPVVPVRDDRVRITVTPADIRVHRLVRDSETGNWVWLDVSGVVPDVEAAAEFAMGLLDLGVSDQQPATSQLHVRENRQNYAGWVQWTDFASGVGEAQNFCGGHY